MSGGAGLGRGFPLAAGDELRCGGAPLGLFFRV